jgi:hypothetical protein
MKLFVLLGLLLFANASKASSRTFDVSTLKQPQLGNQAEHPLGNIQKSSLDNVSDSQNRLKGRLSVMGGVLSHLALGTIYCWANLMSYSPLHLRFFDGKQHPGMAADSLLASHYHGSMLYGTIWSNYC